MDWDDWQAMMRRFSDEAELDLQGKGGEISKIGLPVREDRCQCGESLGRTWRLLKNAQRKTGLGETTIKL